jgi:hypothetical protein
MTEKYIYLTDKKKIKNPIFDTNKCDIKAYHGPIDDLDFEHQTNNYLNLTKSLEPFNIKLTVIWYGKFNVNRSHFVVKSDDGNFYWQKYEGMSSGSGQNRIFIKGNQYKTTKWLSYTQEERENIFNTNIVIIN